MMEKSDIKLIIRRKIEEHKREVVGATKFQEDMKDMIKQARSQLTDEKKVDIIGVKNMFGIYEKIKFHKTCIEVLNDLILEIENAEKVSQISQSN